MSEREIRETVKAVMAELDRRAKRVGRGVRKVMLPAAMGTALAMSGCDSGREVVNDAARADARADVQVPGVDAAYMGPDVPVYMGPDAGVDISPGPDAAYMGPDVAVDPEMGVLYMGPEAGVDLAGDVMAPEVGVLYMGPEAGVDPDAAATDATVGEMGLLYMAPGPDASDELGVAPLYMAPPEEPSFDEK
jgi:hypothetical protein